MLAIDVTHDYGIELTNDDYKYFGNLNANPNKWTVDTYHNGIEFLSKNGTKRRKVNFKVYGKYNEMRLDRNSKFLKWVDDGAGVMKTTIRKTRVELEIRSLEMMRKYFQTDDLSLKNILSSEVNPIEIILNEVADYDVEPYIGDFLIPLHKMKVGQVKDYLILERCEFDIERVFALLKLTMSPKSKPKLALAKYRDILARIDEQKDSGSHHKVMELINKIKEIQG